MSSWDLTHMATLRDLVGMPDDQSDEFVIEHVEQLVEHAQLLVKVAAVCAERGMQLRMNVVEAIEPPVWEATLHRHGGVRVWRGTAGDPLGAVEALLRGVDLWPDSRKEDS